MAHHVQQALAIGDPLVLAQALQRALMQWRKPQNRKLVLEALEKTGRQDLIGYGKHCLVRPDKASAPAGASAQGKSYRKETEKRNKPVKKAEENRSSGHSGRKAGWAKAKPKNTKGRGINKRK